MADSLVIPRDFAVVIASSWMMIKLEGLSHIPDKEL